MTATQDWGTCKGCNHWQIEPDAKPIDATPGVCVQDDLRPFQLRVLGNSGCNHHEDGEPLRAAGAATAPPSPMPTY